MKPLRISVACLLLLPSCAANPPLHERPANLAPGEDVWRLAPDGAISSDA